MGEILLSFSVLAERRVDKAVDVVRLRVPGVERYRVAQLVERDLHLTALVVAAGELGVQLRAHHRRRGLQRSNDGAWDNRLGLRGLARACAEERERQKRSGPCDGG